MRAFEFIAEGKRSPHYSLRQLNSLKHEIRAREQSFARRSVLVAQMYQSPSERQEMAELNKQQLDLEKEKLELLAQKLEMKTQYKDVLSDMRKSEMERRKKQKNEPRFGRNKKIKPGRPN